MRVEILFYFVAEDFSRMSLVNCYGSWRSDKLENERVEFLRR